MAYQEPWCYDSRLQDRPAAYGWLEDAYAAAQARLPLLFPTPGNDTLVMSFSSFRLGPFSCYSSHYGCLLCVEFWLHSWLLMTALNYAYTLVVPSSFFILFSLFLKLILCCCLGLHAFCSLDYVVVVVVPLDSLLGFNDHFFIIIVILKGLKKVRATGIGVHSQEEIIQMGKDDLKVLSDMLGTNTFFFGSEPTTVSVLISLT